MENCGNQNRKNRGMPISTLIFILGYVDQAKEEGAEIFQTEVPEALKATKGLYYPPTLITHVNAASTVVMEEIFGPVAVALPFRYFFNGVSIYNL